MAFPILCRRGVCLGLPDCSFDLSAPAVSPSDVQLGAHAARRAICSAADAGGLPTPTKRSPHTLRLLCRSRRALCGPDPVLAGRRQTAIPLGCECPRSRPCRALERADGTSVHRDDCPSDVGGGRRQQENGDSAELFRFPVSAERDVLRLPGTNLLGIASECVDLADSISGDTDRHQSIDAYASGAILVRQRLYDARESGEEAIGDGEIRQRCAYRRSQHEYERCARPGRMTGALGPQLCGKQAP